MKKMTLTIISSLLLITQYVPLNAKLLQGKSVFNPRSQSINAARELVGVHKFMYEQQKDYINGHIGFTTAYNQSVRPNHIAWALFGVDYLSISGSMVDNRGPQDLLADYFGLSPQFSSVVHIKPSIKNALFLIDGYVEFGSRCPGLYMRAYVPVVWTKWQINLREVIEQELDQFVPFPPLYMDVDEVTPPIDSFTQALTGHVTFGKMQERLRFGKIGCPESKAGLSDVQYILGYNFIRDYDRHAGLCLRLGIPTGTRTKSKFLFEPIVGSRRHWEFGGGFSGHTLVWEQDGDQELSFYAEVYFTHLFSHTEKRSFDLTANAFASRYMLVKEFDADGNDTGNLAPLINKTTFDCKIHVNLQLDMVFMFAYTYRNFVFDLGYNGWIRSAEKLSLEGCIPPHRYALKGIQNTYINSIDPSTVTESGATIFGHEFSEQSLVADAVFPIFVATQDINIHSAEAPRAITHKIFTYFGYDWTSEQKAAGPFVGFGGEIEFEGDNNRNSYYPNKNTLSQWGVWFKVGYTH